MRPGGDELAQRLGDLGRPDPAHRETFPVIAERTVVELTQRLLHHLVDERLELGAVGVDLEVRVETGLEGVRREHPLAE